MPASPTATVLVLNHNGEGHLRACLPSLEALDYPGARITVVDNGSRDGSLEYVRRAHPGVGLIELGSNLGFAPAYNAAVRQTSTDLIAILNNDTRVAASWLSELVAAIERNHAAAAASAIVDWDGARVDFAGGLPTFLGHSWQLDHGEPVGREYMERPLLFASGGSMLITREAFLDAGGFDDDFFAYFEDVDLGWRLNVLGRRIVFAPQAVTYHRLHGTASGWSHALRLRLYERNALATLFKNYGDEALARVLPAAIALTLARCAHASGLDAESICFGREPPATADVHPAAIATLIALEDFAGWLPALREKRRRIQSRRATADTDIFKLFPDPLRLHAVSDSYRAAAETLMRDFRIAELFGLAPPAPVVPVQHPWAPPAAPVAAPAPLVSIVVLTASGPKHLPECLESLRQHAWPAAQTEVIVVDNGSAEDPTSVVERHYPGAKVIRTGDNLGFAGGNNAGARAASGEYIVFLNDDTRVAPDWLTRLVDVARRRQAASVGALILDWDGEHVDFAGGLVNLEGRGFSVEHGLPTEELTRIEQPELFACGAAVLFRTDIFRATGAWDENTFAYYEDVEIGWRLWILGHEVWLAPDAIVYHKHHGTSGQASAPRDRALDRNALRMLYTHLEEDTLQRVLPAALMLAADRALLGTPFSRAAEEGSRTAFGTLARRLRPRVLKIRLLHALSQRGARRQRGAVANLRVVGFSGLAAAVVQVVRDLAEGWDSPGGRAQYLIEQTPAIPTLASGTEKLPIQLAATLLGIDDFFHALPSLSAKRAWLQASRKRRDAEIIDRFGKYWFNAVPASRPELHESRRSEILDTLVRRTT